MEYNPNEQELQTAKWVDSLFHSAQSGKATRQKIIDECYKKYKGKYYTDFQKKNKKKATSQRDYIFSSVEDALALLTDSKPSLDCWPREKQDISIAEKTKQVLDWIWEVTRMDEKLPNAERDFLIAGIGWLKVYFDPDVNYPHGEIAVDVVHPDYIFIDPDATSLDKAKFIIQRTPTPLWLIRKEYEKGIYVKPDETISEDTDETIPADTNREVDGVGRDYETKHERAWLIELWIRDDATFEEDEGEHKKGEAKYPNGRRIVVANGVVLSDDHNPFDDGGFPYVPFLNYEQSDTFWPMGDVEHLDEVNNDINKIVSRLNDWIRYSAHSYIIYDKEANIDEDSMDNLEGAKILKDKGGDVNIVSPPPMPASIFEWLNQCKSDLEIISGIREVLQGRDPKAGKSGVAFERLQEFALSRIRKKARNIDNGLVKLGELFISRIKQFYPEERQIRITGDFSIQQTDATGQPMMGADGQPEMKAVGYDFIPFSGQELYETNEAGKVVREIKLDVVVETGAAGATTRAKERDEAEFLFVNHIIDEEEVARRYGIKNYQEIKTRMEQKEMEMMQRQMQMQFGMAQPPM